MTFSPAPDAVRTNGSHAEPGDPLASVWNLRPREHFAAVGVLTALLIARWWVYFVWPIPLNDEMTYFRAASSLARGGSPYQPGYLYPALPAILSAFAIRHLSVGGWTLSLRFLNDVGAAVMTWLAVCWLPWQWWKRTLLGAAIVVLSPAVHFAIFTANMSLLTGGLVAVALLVWPRLPLLSGTLLGISVGLKPFAPGAIAVLGLHRSRPDRHRRAWLSAGVATLVGAALLFGLPDSTQFLRLHINRIDPMLRTVSVHRLAHLLGWGHHLFLLSAGLLLVALWLVRRRRLNVGELYGAAVATALATTPIVWAHTMIITLPLQVLAVQRAVVRLRDGSEAVARRRRYELVFVVLACAALQFAEGASAVYRTAFLWQALAVLPPTLAPAGLTAYVVITAKAPASRLGPAAIDSPSDSGPRRSISPQRKS